MYKFCSPFSYKFNSALTAEGITLIASVEKYRERHGVYPEAILEDKIYRNRDNLDYCKKHGIRLSGPRLGRPKVSEIDSDRDQAFKDSCERNMVEGRIGINKRRYGLDLIYDYPWRVRGCDERAVHECGARTQKSFALIVPAADLGIFRQVLCSLRRKLNLSADSNYQLC